MTVLNQLLAALKIEAEVFHNGQYCGAWAVDTSGNQRMNFHVVTRGIGYLKVDEQWELLNLGDAVFFPSDSAHRLCGSQDETSALNAANSSPMTEEADQDATGLVCGYFGHQHPMFNRLIGHMPGCVIVRYESDSPATCVLNLMVEESQRSDQSQNLLLNRLADCLLYLLLRDHIDTEYGIFAAQLDPKLSRALALMHDESGRKLSVDELAASAGMSRSAFATSFKTTVGQSPSEYLTQWRMMQAYRWLADDGVSTLEAALRCGYESEASFSKAFKRAIGDGPGKVRKAGGATTI